VEYVAINIKRHSHKDIRAVLVIQFSVFTMNMGSGGPLVVDFRHFELLVVI
jgi:hypothetical protein